jgi:hypothetical protein
MPPVPTLNYSALPIDTAFLASAAADRVRHLLRQPSSWSRNIEIGKELDAARELLGNRYWKRWLALLGFSEKIGRDCVHYYLCFLPLTPEEYRARLDDLRPQAARARAKRARLKAAREASGQPQTRRSR